MLKWYIQRGAQAVGKEAQKGVGLTPEVMTVEELKLTRKSR